MSEWDDSQYEPNKPEKKGPKAGKWNAAMTFVPLVAVAVVSFGMAYLNQSVEQRSLWMLSLTFAAPVAVMMLSVLLLEKMTSSMTPRVSRKAQAGVAAAVIALAAIAGGSCHMSNTEVQVVQKGWSNVIILLDKSGSMASRISTSGPTRDDIAVRAVQSLLNQMDDSVSVGMVIDVGSSGINNTVNMEPLSMNRSSLNRLIRTSPSGGTNFNGVIGQACWMFSQYPANSGIKIIMITDGEDSFSNSNARSQILSYGVQFNYIRIGGAAANSQLQALVRTTGGVSIDANDLNTLTSTMEGIVMSETTTFDALRQINMSTRTEVVVGILMLFLGVLLGLSLMLMFSLQGQRRFQVVLSPLMAIISFCLLAFGEKLIPSAFLREGIAFTLLGVIMMRSNKLTDKEEKGQGSDKGGNERANQVNTLAAEMNTLQSDPDLPSDW